MIDCPCKVQATPPADDIANTYAESSMSEMKHARSHMLPHK